ncbi:MAG: hypothetical protein ACRER3_16445, partial [Pseudomonas fluorescens]
MSDITHLDRSGLPSSRSLIKATVIALIAAAALLTAVVLPAEYGIDPTGLGSRLGLMAMSADLSHDGRTSHERAGEKSAPTVADPAVALAGLWNSQTPYRSDELSLTLQPDSGAEIKARMDGGQRFVFMWTAENGAVSFDMHGEASDAKNGEFTSYRKAGAHSYDQGVFVAPFDGTHGW